MNDTPRLPLDPQLEARMTRVRRRWERLLLLGLAAAFVGVVAAFWPVVRGLRQQVPSANLTFLSGLLVVLLLAAMVIGLVFFRYLLRMLIEGRWRVPGYRLRYRLVALFLGFATIPTLLLFAVARGVVFDTIDRWFNLAIEQHLREAYEVAQTHYKSREESLNHFTDQIASQLVDGGYLDRPESPELTKFLESRLLEYNLSEIELYSVEHYTLASVTNPSLPPDLIPEPELALLEEGLQGKRANQIKPVGEGIVLRRILPISASRLDPRVDAVVIAGDYQPRNLYDKMQGISRSYGEFQRLVVEKQPIKAAYFLMLLVLSLVLIFGALWAGFRVARSIAVPIAQLAEATQKVAEGDWARRIESSAGDEIGLLVRSFNRMTRDLALGRERLDETVRALEGSNVELEERRRFMEIVLRNVSAGVMAFDRFGALRSCNRSAEQLLALDSAPLVGQPWTRTFPRAFREALTVMIADLSARRAQAEEGQTPDAPAVSLPASIARDVDFPIGEEPLRLSIHLSLLHSERNEYLGLAVVLENMTEVARSQRAAAWREVARRIAHEIKNPLTPIRLSAERMGRRMEGRLSGPDAELLQGCVRTIVQQVDEMKRMVGEFSDFAKLPESTPRPADINRLLRDAAALYTQAHRDLELQLDLDPLTPIFEFDPDQMRRAAVNLLENAVAAVQGRGRLQVRTQFLPNWRLCRIEVTDDGPGIPPEDRERIFEPYFSTKPEGSGLGLAIVANIVADHRGFIRCVPNRPRGARFLIELPVGEAASRERPPDSGRPAPMV